MDVGELTLEDSVSILGTEESIKDLTDKLTDLAKQVHNSYKKAYVGIYEALRNAWQHAHKKTDKPIKVNYSITPEKFLVTITDQGNGFDHDFVERIIKQRNRENSTKTFYELTGQDNGGLGLGTILMHVYMDRINYQKNGSEVVLTKYPMPA